MKERTYKNGVTFYANDEMYETIKQLSDSMEISLGQLIREAIDEYLAQQEK